MTLLGVLFIACIATFFIGIAVSPGNVFRGWPAIFAFFGMCSTGLVLAVHAL